MKYFLNKLLIISFFLMPSLATAQQDTNKSILAKTTADVMKKVEKLKIKIERPAFMIAQPKITPPPLKIGENDSNLSLDGPRPDAQTISAEPEEMEKINIENQPK